MLVVLISLVVFLLSLSSILAALETAIVGTSPARVKMKTDSNPKNSSILLSLLKNKEKVISTLLITVSVVNVVATTVFTGVIIEVFGQKHGTLISSFVMSILTIVFAEVIPKAIAVSKAESISLASSPYIYYIVKILNPLNNLLSYLVKITCYIFKIDTKSNISPDEEVRGVIEHYHSEGEVVKDERDMLGAILDLDKTNIDEIMVHRSEVFSIDIKKDIKETVEILLSSPYTRVPFWEDSKENIIGILHIRDLIKSLIKNNFEYNKLDIRDVLSLPLFISENSRLSTQLVNFRKIRNHFAIVVDEYGDMMGIVTLEDILEEIVGQIDDEYDLKNTKIQERGNKKYLVDGSLTIRDLNRELDLNLSDDDYHTVAGLIIKNLGKIPDLAEIVFLDNLRFTVLKKNANKITKILIEILD